MTSRREEAENAVRACYSSWAQTYYGDYYAADTAYPPVHRKLIADLLADSGARHVLDAGCGPASMLRDLPSGLELYGFDLTPEMVEEARAVLADRVMPDRIWQGSVTDPAAYRRPDDADAYDAAICIGVLPHVHEEDDAVVFENLVRSVRPGGIVAVEARNAFFALYTLNRHTRDFFFNELLPLDLLRANASDEWAELEAALEDLTSMFRVDLPPIRRGSDGGPGYDEIVARTHNPLRLKEMGESIGLNDVRVLYYHFHALPPVAGARVPKTERAISLEIEDPADWRGLFMASAFVVTGVR